MHFSVKCWVGDWGLGRGGGGGGAHDQGTCKASYTAQFTMRHCHKKRKKAGPKFVPLYKWRINLSLSQKEVTRSWYIISEQIAFSSLAIPLYPSLVE